jgi:toxin ParE1/3/4
MASRRVDYSDRAKLQLAELYSYLLNNAGERRAEAFVGKIVDYCNRFSSFPELGTRRDDLSLGLRIVGYRRRATIAFTVEPERVLIHGIFYGGQDHIAALRDQD